MEEKQYSTIVFDVGDVLVHFRWKESMLELGMSESDADILGRQMIFSNYWQLMDEGSVEDSTAPDYFKKHIPEYTAEIDRFFDNIEDVVSEYSYSRGLIIELKEAGYQVYLLSNYPKDIAKIHWSKFSFIDDVDGYIISAREHLTKPNPAIYRILNERFGVEPARAVFVDDRQDNVKGAIEVGMDGILFTGYDDLLDEFHKRQIILPKC